MTRETHLEKVVVKNTKERLNTFIIHLSNLDCSGGARVLDQGGQIIFNRAPIFLRKINRYLSFRKKVQYLN